MLKNALTVAFILVIIIAGDVSCGIESSRISLADFESLNELNGLIWQCHRWFSLSDSNVTQGLKALKAEIRPSNDPILRVFLSEDDWGTYNWFVFDVFNPHLEESSLSIRFIDKNSDADSGRIYTKVCNLTPGHNSIRIAMDEIKNGPEKRSLYLHKMDKVALLISGNRKKYILFFDNMVLTK